MLPSKNSNKAFCHDKFCAKAVYTPARNSLNLHSGKSVNKALFGTATTNIRLGLTRRYFTVYNNCLNSRTLIGSGLLRSVRV